jgi:GNAT superfamily N-acetyltransferase
MTVTPTIRRAADDADVAAAADLIARSFDHLEANNYLVPDPDRRLGAMREWFHILTEHAANGAGEVLFTGDGSAVTVWFDRTVEPTEPYAYEKRLEEAAGEFVDRFQELDTLFEAHHPTEPHWHGAFFAVDPNRWGQGLGTKLVSHTLARLDREGVPAYLEATNDANRRLYSRLGWHDMDPTELVLGDGTTFYRMWRPAGG